MCLEERKEGETPFSKLLLFFFLVFSSAFYLPKREKAGWLRPDFNFLERERERETEVEEDN